MGKAKQTEPQDKQYSQEQLTQEVYAKADELHLHTQGMIRQHIDMYSANLKEYRLANRECDRKAISDLESRLSALRLLAVVLGYGENADEYSGIAELEDAKPEEANSEDADSKEAAAS